ncbi:type IX secretion system sortase PorU [Negadavirga shengliensis]|uniref:Type IX secretion system sortase PorU n=1 Tax=Negadavirga shengliensis TaxID=1389218 RepID=A0ABV9T3V1_9BACT
MWARHEIKGFLGLLSMMLPLQWVMGQEYKFPITQEGVYKITAQQARQWGAGSVDEISIYGFGGMLPQKLDSSIFTSGEIPVQKIGEDLYFYLSAAHRIFLEESHVSFEPHLYTDTLHYILNVGKPSTSEIKDKGGHSLATEDHLSTGVLYQIQSYKKEEVNILNSGRKWYGDRMFNGNRIRIPFKRPEGTADQPVWLSVSVMAQSHAASHFELNVDNQNVGALQVASVPNSTYAVKGREEAFNGLTAHGSQDELAFSCSFQTGNPNGLGYLDYVLVGFPFASDALPEGVYYNLEGKNIDLGTAAAQKIWDVTRFHQIEELGEEREISSDISKFVVFDPSNVPAINQVKAINGTLKTDDAFPELLIITSGELQGQAKRLSEHKNNTGVSAKTVLLEDIYDHFGYGNPDIVAIRNFLAYQFHIGGALKNTLFFGKGTFDYKNKLGGRPNLVPTYSSRSSLNPLTTYSSDDFFGFLQMGEGEWEESQQGDHQLDIGTGRVPAINVREAAIAVNKIIQYSSLETGAGDWKRKVLFLADDGDNNIHLHDSESHAAYLHENNPEFSLQKLYLDSYEQVQAGSSQRSPQAKETLTDYIDRGVLLINYIGHGNETTLAAEELFTIGDIRNWPENDKLPVFVTATCEFGRHDSPFIRSGAEELLFAEKKGAIALLTTGRPVFSSINFSLNKAFIETVFIREGGEYISLGEIFKYTKNNSLNGALNRNFSLLGDPSLKLKLPDYWGETAEFWDIDVETSVDTLGALQRVRYKGAIQDPLTGAQANGFNGSFEIALYDKALMMKTLGDESPETHYKEYNNAVFRGTGTVEGGVFEGEMVIGQPIKDEFDLGVVRVFARNPHDKREAMGANKIMVGGISDNLQNDSEGPSIKINILDSLQSAKKINTSQAPIWIFLKDKSGINISENNIDQQISLTLNDQMPRFLNRDYRSLHSSYQEGYIKTTLKGLREGINTLTVRVFDNLGNMSEKTMEIEVYGIHKLKIYEAVSYPNPAREASFFRINHNRPGENLSLQLRIFSLLGHEIFSMTKRFPRANPGIDGIDWIFLHDKTKYPVKGTYLYEIALTSEEDGTSDRKGGKIIIQ